MLKKVNEFMQHRWHCYAAFAGAFCLSFLLIYFGKNDSAALGLGIGIGCGAVTIGALKIIIDVKRYQADLYLNKRTKDLDSEFQSEINKDLSLDEHIGTYMTITPETTVQEILDVIRKENLETKAYAEKDNKRINFNNLAKEKTLRQLEKEGWRAFSCRG